MKLFFLSEYLTALLNKDAEAVRSFFSDDAMILWHNTNECFTPDEYAAVNAAYPSDWHAEVEHELRIGESDNELIIAACRIWSSKINASNHMISFIQVHRGYIVHIDEYWGEDGLPPEWRRQMRIGRPIS